MRDKYERKEQYRRDLVTISGGLPKKGLANKVGFSLTLFMNGVLYDEEIAHRKAEEFREMVKKQTMRQSNLRAEDVKLVSTDPRLFESNYRENN